MNDRFFCKKILKLLILCLFCFVSAGSHAADAGKKSVIDYYRLGPDGMLGGLKYNLEMKEGKWHFYNPKGEELDVIIDVPKGFMMITDTKTIGYARKDLQLSIFSTDKNDLIIGVNWYTVDSSKGIYSSTGAQFYKYTESQMDGCCWENVNLRLMKMPEIVDFLNPFFDISKSAGLNELIVESDKEYGLFRYTLNQSGASFTVSLNLTPFDYLKVTAGVKERKAIQDLMKNIRYKEIRYQWDPKNGKFDLSGKK